MERYLGTKAVNAKPMTRQEYNDFRGWSLPADENGADEGYLVEYTNGGAANTKEYDGYVSWSPKDIFERAYKQVGTHLSFGGALNALESGYKVARLVNTNNVLGYLPGLGIHISYGNDFNRRWVPHQNDILAKDWVVITE